MNGSTDTNITLISGSGSIRSSPREVPPMHQSTKPCTNLPSTGSATPLHKSVRPGWPHHIAKHASMQLVLHVRDGLAPPPSALPNGGCSNTSFKSTARGKKLASLRTFLTVRCNFYHLSHLILLASSFPVASHSHVLYIYSNNNIIECIWPLNEITAMC
jgi:hypothetical protein